MKKEIFNEEVAAQIAGALLGAQAVQLKIGSSVFRLGFGVAFSDLL